MFRSLSWISVLQYIVIALACLVAATRAAEPRTHRTPIRTAMAHG